MMKRLFKHIVSACFAILLFTGCEKEIQVDLPPAPKSYVVEASINLLFPNLNYVFITQTLDYFNPDLSFNGVKGALVYITAGTVQGNDTTYNEQNRIQLFDISTVPIIDTLLAGFSGVYFSPLLLPQVGTPYKLEIFVDGTEITGYTHIPPVVPIDTVYYRQEIEGEDTNMFVTFEIIDGPEQNNYRLAVENNPNPFLIGWGAADFFRTFDDQFLNNGRRPYSFFRPFAYGDTLNLYFSSITRDAFLFWQSYSSASNNGGPFATPVKLKSNISGAIGSFTGYGMSFRQTILR